jgi:hypothetical protein
MVPNLNSVIAILVLGTPILILIVFLPALVELKKPKDCGPRMIMDHFPNGGLAAAPISHLTNIEEDQKFTQSLFRQLTKILEFLPNLEV